MLMFQRITALFQRVVGRNGQTVSVKERRVWVRHRSSVRAILQSVDKGGEPGQPAEVTSISRGGLHLLVDRPFEPGDLLSVELPTVLPDRLRSTVLACVIHVTPHDKNRWGVGCSFSVALDDDDLAAFGARRVRPGGADLRHWV